MIDRETVQRILDAADIVEVVSDYVTLKRSGASYIGLCPFHNERTPSFSVSRAKGLCKCFSCGKGGSPVNFLMELEQISYTEALKRLAKKYNIEVKERELTDAERQQASERESLFAVNDFALNYFEHNLTDTDDGRDIGLSYFRERGINDWAIKRFRLGYSLPKGDALYRAATAKGFNEKYLFDTGLCAKTEEGRVYDRFRGRVIYPIFTTSGRVVAFGGRILQAKKEGVGKYVNSPESAIYHKSVEVYGLYQARQAIAKKDRCIMVEGYMDVISMHQSGIENVVASSGTSLTEGQIHKIKLITRNLTVIYDSDAAGIKASLRGINLLLAAGMNVKVVLLPEGDDPDSFAQHHSSSEVEEYIEKNSQDFIAFKTDILLKGVSNDPIARANVITDVIESIALIPDPITRNVYIQECANRLGMSEKLIVQQCDKLITARRDKEALKQAKEAAARTLQGLDQIQDTATQTQEIATKSESTEQDDAIFLAKFERAVLRYALKYGAVEIGDEAYDQEGNPMSITVIDYILGDLEGDGLAITTPLYARAINMAAQLLITEWPAARDRSEERIEQERREMWDRGVAEIRDSGCSVADIDRREKELQARCDEMVAQARDEVAQHFIEKQLASCDDDEIRRLTTDLVSDRYQLSKIHTKHAHIETEEERLYSLVERAVYELKDAVLECQQRSIRRKIKDLCSQEGYNPSEVLALMQENKRVTEIKAEFAKFLGERIVAPRR
ncbi:MAG: DNA primase [Bacteroidales bacterium]|nr:DNA primase [Bacteroidales bacterium]